MGGATALSLYLERRRGGQGEGLGKSVPIPFVLSVADVAKG